MIEILQYPIIFGLFSIAEILYLVITSLVIGYIFTGLFTPRIKNAYDYLNPKRFDMRDFKFAVLITAPAVILHELAHKFTAMAYGLPAEFHISVFGLGIGVFLKLIAAPFIIIAPGYVSIPGVTDPSALALIAFAGPLVNLILWLGSRQILKSNYNLKRKTQTALALTAKINMILFFFNMIPLPPFDGSKVISGLYQLIF